jgi:hypothetical protein
VYREPRKGSTFSKKAVITAIRDGGRSYVLETPRGSTTLPQRAELAAADRYLLPI